MGYLITQFKYYFIRFFRTREIVFYTFMLPLILAVLYYFATSQLMTGELDTIPIGVMPQTGFINYENILSNIELFSVELMEQDQAQNLLLAGEIDAFINNEGQMLINESSINTSIIKTIMDQIHQISSLGADALNIDPSLSFIGVTDTPASFIIIMFYGLIGMVSLYGGFYGVQITNEILASLSPFAARLNTTPIKPAHFIGLNALNAILVNLTSNFLLVIFIQYILNINIIEHLGISIWLIVLGNMFGLLLGMVFGLIPKITIDAKIQLMTAATLILTFLAGGMVPEIQNFVNSVVPGFNQFNPVNIITENLYRINLLNDSTKVLQGTIIMLSGSLILFVIATLYLRRKRYDSI